MDYFNNFQQSCAHLLITPRWPRRERASQRAPRA